MVGTKLNDFGPSEYRTCSVLEPSLYSSLSSLVRYLSGLNHLITGLHERPLFFTILNSFEYRTIQQQWNVTPFSKGGSNFSFFAAFYFSLLEFNALFVFFYVATSHGTYCIRLQYWPLSNQLTENRYRRASGPDHLSVPLHLFSWKIK